MPKSVRTQNIFFIRYIKFKTQYEQKLQYSISDNTECCIC